MTFNEKFQSANMAVGGGAKFFLLLAPHHALFCVHVYITQRGGRVHVWSPLHGANDRPKEVFVPPQSSHEESRQMDSQDDEPTR